uniref:ATP synthase subunit b, chloroplastic n=1 Tax=Trentepohlia odorata TaxID=2576626 RepID=A0A4Y5P3K8_9CHLO|nr:ATP synthase CF0 subunit I [Trentepohlia odorata]QCW57835.1 ATP synthase CF0 subunit I [Trentepohlia odorata]
MSLIEKIFETNVINLSIVIFILVSVVGNALTESLSARRETVLLNLTEADKKATEAEEKLRLAKADFETAKNKAIELKEQNKKQAENEKTKLLTITDNEIQGLKKKKQEILELAYSQQKKELIAKIANAALRIVKQRCKFDSNTGEKIANFYLKLWTAS